MKRFIKINGKEYAFEYSIEASQHENFVDKLIDMFSDVQMIADISERAQRGERLSKDEMKVLLNYTAKNVPALAFTGFHAGLLEHQRVSYDEAKELYKKYLEEYKKTPMEAMNTFFEMAKEDNFPQLIGLDMTATAPQISRKVPSRSVKQSKRQ